MQDPFKFLELAICFDVPGLRNRLIDKRLQSCLHVDVSRQRQIPGSDEAWGRAGVVRFLGSPKGHGGINHFNMLNPAFGVVDCSRLNACENRFYSGRNASCEQAYGARRGNRQ
jgi:hypothetical protein